MQVFMKQKWTWSVSLFFLFIPTICQGAGYEQHFAAACARWKVPPKLALAIARHESGMNPWAINIAGQSFLLQSREEALRHVNFAWRKGYSFDVGLMQVNSAWFRKFGISPETALEPRNNVLLGVWILAQEIERYGLTWRAVASYHTPVARNPERGRRYAAAVIGQMTKARP